MMSNDQLWTGKYQISHHNNNTNTVSFCVLNYKQLEDAFLFIWIVISERKTKMPDEKF